MASATATKTTGFAVKCPHCHNEDARVTIDLNNVQECTCSDCDSTFSAEDACSLLVIELAHWQKVARWVEIGREMAAAK